MSEHRLSEIVIERPRRGMRIPSRKITGTKKFLDRLTQEATNDGLLTPYLIKPTQKTKYLSDHLGPLKRLLRSKVGQPWNQVKSELHDRLDASTMVGRHVLDHVEDYVVEKVEFIEGQPYGKEGRRWFRARLICAFHEPQFYVHPETGLLCLAEKCPPLPSHSQASTISTDTIPIDRDHRYQKINGIWYWVTLAQLPPNLPVWDVVEKAIVQSRYSGTDYAIHKRQCSKQELKKLRQRYPQV